MKNNIRGLYTDSGISISFAIRFDVALLFSSLEDVDVPSFVGNQAVSIQFREGNFFILTN